MRFGHILSTHQLGLSSNPTESKINIFTPLEIHQEDFIYVLGCSDTKN